MRWINPFIIKLADHEDLIFCFKKGLEKELSLKLQELTQKKPKIYLEICSGSGQHCLELARQNQDATVVGIELRFKRIVRTAEKAKKYGIHNLFLLQMQAESIQTIFQNASIDKIFINFPDPWDKKAYWNNRFLLSTQYLSILSALLKQSGEFAFKTDHQRRFLEVLNSIETEPLGIEIKEKSFDLHNSEFKDENIITEFESLFISQKKPAFYLKAKKS